MSYSVQNAWLWVGHHLSAMIVLKGIAFREMVLDPVVTLDVNHTGKMKLDLDGPTYIPGKVIGAGQFVKVETPEDMKQGFQGYYYYELEKVIIFGYHDAADLRFSDGKRPVQGYPDVELRKVYMG